MYSTQQWSLSRSQASGVQFLCIFGTSAAQALILDTGAIQPKWHSAWTTLAAEHLYDLFERVGSNFRWNAPFDAIDIVELKALPDSSKLLDVAYDQGNAYVSSDALLDFMEGLFELINHKQTEQIERLLSTAEPARLAPEISVGLLRATAHFAHSLPSWKRCYHITYEELTKRKLDADKVLVGLRGGVRVIAQQP